MAEALPSIIPMHSFQDEKEIDLKLSDTVIRWIPVHLAFLRGNTKKKPSTPWLMPCLASPEAFLSGGKESQLRIGNSSAAVTILREWLEPISQERRSYLSRNGDRHGKGEAGHAWH